jgi:hypothetical protein
MYLVVSTVRNSLAIDVHLWSYSKTLIAAGETHIQQIDAD